MTHFGLLTFALLATLVPAHYAQQQQQLMMPQTVEQLEVPKAAAFFGGQLYSTGDSWLMTALEEEEESIGNTANTLVRKKRCNNGGNFPGFGGTGGIPIPGFGGGTGGGGGGSDGTANSPGRSQGRFGGRIGQWGRQAWRQFTGGNGGGGGGGNGGNSQFSPGRSGGGGGRQQGRNNGGGFSGGWGFGR